MLSSVEGRAQKPAHHASTELSMTSFLGKCLMVGYYSLKRATIKKSVYIACYSVFKLFIGFANAAFMAWKLTVINVISIAPIAVTINTHQTISV